MLIRIGIFGLIFLMVMCIFFYIMVPKLHLVVVFFFFCIQYARTQGPNHKCNFGPGLSAGRTRLWLMMMACLEMPCQPDPKKNRHRNGCFKAKFVSTRRELLLLGSCGPAAFRVPSSIEEPNGMARHASLPPRIRRRRRRPHARSPERSIRHQCRGARDEPGVPFSAFI